MLSRDLMATVVRTFFEELSDIRNAGKKEEAQVALAGMYATYFQQGRDWFLRASVDEITTFFVDDPIYKLEMLTELMYQDSRMLEDAEIQGLMYRKLMALYDVIDTTSHEFSMERMNRTVELQSWLMEHAYVDSSTKA